MFEKALELQNEQNKGSSAVKLEKKKKDDNDGDDDNDDKKLTKSQQKEANRQKLNEARKRYAEKYGDEYHED